ncbi:MAG: mechanosensitive ion channel [Sulfitobacter sp.]|nr:mechanosensitive ion channel [Sulfitobacter sp.]
MHVARLPSPFVLLVALLALFALALPASAQEDWFSQSGLNEGLEPPPSGVDRNTPMGAMESFQYLTRQERYLDAAHLMDLSDIPAEAQSDVGRVLAERLAILVERKVVIPWADLADRPDGYLRGSSDSDQTGRARRSILLDTLDLGTHRVPLRLNRIKPGEEEAAVWVFSAQTVDNIPELFASYGPTELERSLPDWARRESLFGMYLWELIFVPVLTLLAVVLAVVLYRIFRRIGANAKNRWVRFVARSFKWPATIISSAALISFATSNLLVVTGVVDAILAPLLTIAFVFAGTLAVVLIIDEVLDMIAQNTPGELADPSNAHLRSMATTVSAARKFIIVIAVLAGTGLVLSSLTTFWGFGLSLLASAGAVTIVLGFAAREVLGNILASVQIALNRSARIGDQLLFEGHFCTVERIHFTYVQLMIWNGNRLIVPVSYFVQDAFQNWSIEEDEMVRPIILTLAQEADVEKMRQAFFEIIEEEDTEDIGPSEKIIVRVIDQDVFGLKVRFELPTRNPSTFWDLECRVREKLQERARALEASGDLRYLPPPASDLPEG